MSDLRDFRIKITVETHCWLEAESRATGQEKQEIVRRILHEHAQQRISQANILSGLLRAEQVDTGEK